MVLYFKYIPYSNTILSLKDERIDAFEFRYLKDSRNLDVCLI